MQQTHLSNKPDFVGQKLSGAERLVEPDQALHSSEEKALCNSIQKHPVQLNSSSTVKKRYTYESSRVSINTLPYSINYVGCQIRNL